MLAINWQGIILVSIYHSNWWMPHWSIHWRNKGHRYFVLMKNYSVGTKSILWSVKSCIKCMVLLGLWYKKCLAPAPQGHLVTADKLQSFSDNKYGLFDCVICEHSRIPIRNACNSVFRDMGFNSHMPSPFAYSSRGLLLEQAPIGYKSMMYYFTTMILYIYILGINAFFVINTILYIWNKCMLRDLHFSTWCRINVLLNHFLRVCYYFGVEPLFSQSWNSTNAPFFIENIPGSCVCPLLGKSILNELVDNFNKMENIFCLFCKLIVCIYKYIIYIYINTILCFIFIFKTVFSWT